MKKIIIAIVLLTSIQAFSQVKSKKNNTLVTKLKVDILTTIKIDTLLLEPKLEQNKIFVISNGNKLNCLDSAGLTLWQKQLNDSLADKPIIDQSMFFLAYKNGDISKNKVTNGETIESFGIGDSIKSNVVKLDYKWDYELMIPKSSNSKAAVIFATSNNTIHCIDMETLQEYWTSQNLNSIINSNLTLISNKIFFIAKDNSLFCLNAKDGLLIWRWKGNDELIFKPNQIVHDDRYIYLIDTNQKLYVFDSLLGKLDWVQEKYKLSSFQILGKEIIAITNENEIITILNQKVGLKIKLPLTAARGKIFIDENNKRIFIFSESTLYSIDFKNKKIADFTFEGGTIDYLSCLNKNKYLAILNKQLIVIFTMR